MEFLLVVTSILTIVLAIKVSSLERRIERLEFTKQDDFDPLEKAFYKPR